ncbi:MAG: transcription antitermination factor NusB [Pseudarcicella sp.]|nr:transcription antitermination factor NusB [Pseudarcicella sp.]
MVNRRLLRIKAYQYIYALIQSKKAEYHVQLDSISLSFLPNLDLMIPKEEQMLKLDAERKLAEIHYQEYFSESKTEADIPLAIKKAATKAILAYNDNVKKERNRIAHQMVEDIENIYHIYIKKLLLILELSRTAVWDQERRLVETDIPSSKFAKNSVIIALGNLKSLELEAIRKNVKWDDEDINIVRKLFIEAVLPDKDFLAYLKLQAPTFEEDLAIVKHILKNIVLKHFFITDYFEEKSINWALNKDVIKSLCVKTFKISEVDDLELQDLSLNWEDDKVYFVDLFNNTLNNDVEYEKIIAQETQNWDAERLAFSDMIILKMAIAEMIHFSSIPTKVSINEYIDLAKNYSTPKSGQFVNGLLDVISNKLIKQNIIRKSGRGLIDKH